MNSMKLINDFPDTYESLDLKKKIKQLEDKKIKAQKRSKREANQCWIMQSLLILGDKYVSLFYDLKNYNFYEAWCKLEHCEIGIKSIKKNTTSTLPQWFHFIKKVVDQYQHLYPYKIFFSPAYSIENQECSICGAQITIKNRCNHTPGKIYNGKMCSRIITKCSLIEISAVTDPVQKYSVPFSTDKNGNHYDHYDYSLVKKIVDILDNPFENWGLTISKQPTPIHNYSNYNPESLCPCGSSAKFKECCINKKEIPIPHYQFSISEQKYRSL